MLGFSFVIWCCLMGCFILGKKYLWYCYKNISWVAFIIKIQVRFPRVEWLLRCMYSQQYVHCAYLWSDRVIFSLQLIAILLITWVLNPISAFAFVLLGKCNHNHEMREQKFDQMKKRLYFSLFSLKRTILNSKWKTREIRVNSLLTNVLITKFVDAY